MAFGHVAQCRIIGELHGSQTVNVMTFGTNTVINDPPQLETLLLQLAQAMLQCIRDTLLPAVTSDWKLIRTDARDIYPAPSDPVVATALSTDVGQRSPTSCSALAALVHLRTGQNGKRGRGRIFLPPPGEADITASDIDAPTMLLLAAFITCIGEKFMGDAKTTDWQLTVLSRLNATAVGQNIGTAAIPVQSLNPVSTVALLGSRKKGRGA